MNDLPEVERAFSVQSGDRIILEIAEGTPLSHVEGMSEALKGKWPDVEFLVIAGAHVAAVIR